MRRAHSLERINETHFISMLPRTEPNGTRLSSPKRVLRHQQHLLYHLRPCPTWLAGCGRPERTLRWHHLAGKHFRPELFSSGWWRGALIRKVVPYVTYRSRWPFNWTEGEQLETTLDDLNGQSRTSGRKLLTPLQMRFIYHSLSLLLLLLTAYYLSMIHRV